MVSVAVMALGVNTDRSPVIVLTVVVAWFWKRETRLCAVVRLIPTTPRYLDRGQTDRRVHSVRLCTFPMPCSFFRMACGLSRQLFYEIALNCVADHDDHRVAR